MKSVSVLRKAIHTEKGIHDAVPLLPGLPLPKLPIFNEGSSSDDSLIKAKSGSESFDQKVTEMKEREGKISSEAKNQEIPLPPKKPEVKKEDPPPLISFDSPVTPRNRSATVSSGRSNRQLPGFDKNFVPPANWANFGSNSNLTGALPVNQPNPFQPNQPFAFGGTPVALQSPRQQRNPFLQTQQQTTNPPQQQQQQNSSFNPFL